LPFCDRKVSLAASGSAVNKVIISSKRLVLIRIIDKKEISRQNGKNCLEEGMFALCARKEWSGYIISLSFLFVIVGILGF
jgi:hypothetical protein